MAYHEQVRFFPGMQACFNIQRLVSVNCISSYCCYNKLPQTYWLKNNINRLRIFKSLSLSLFIITTPSLTLILLCFAVLNCSAVSDSLQSYGLWPARLLCPWGFSRQEYWSGLPFPSPGDLSNPGVKPVSPALQMDSLPAELPGKSLILLPCFYKDHWDYINFTQII